MATNIKVQDELPIRDDTDVNRKPKPHSAGKKPTVREVAMLSIFILLFTSISVVLFVKAFQRFEIFKLDEQVKWENARNYKLESGPVWFVYESEDSILRAIQPIDENDKKVLLKLYPADSVGYDAYRVAIDNLAFKTQKADKVPYLLILLIGGIAAVIGVQIRTMQRFVQHACFEYDLDIKRWWPWYLMRPFAGFLLGSAIILLAQVKLLSFTNGDSSVYFWIGLATLVGFGTPDVLYKLHKLSETLFGTNNEENTHKTHLQGGE